VRRVPVVGDPHPDEREAAEATTPPKAINAITSAPMPSSAGEASAADSVGAGVAATADASE